MLWQVAVVVFTAWWILADPCPALEGTLAGEVQVLLALAVIFRSETRTTLAWKDMCFLPYHKALSISSRYAGA